MSRINNYIRFINANSSKEEEEIEFVNLIHHHFGNPNFILPQNFTIITQNNSFKFNIDMIRDISPVYFTSDKINLNIKDETNVMFKFKQLCDGNIVTFSTEDIFKMNEIIQALNLKCFPNFVQKIISNGKSSDSYSYKLVMNKELYLYFLQSISKSFTIKTKKSEYKCNSFGVNSSQVISKFIQDNHNIHIYSYDFDDENNDFQVLCDFFNFSSIILTPTNYQIIKKISKDLQIEFLLNKIDNFTSNYLYFTRIINEHKLSINSVEFLVKHLYNRKGLDVESVKNFIVHSIWSSEERYVLELSSYIFQVINNSIKSHQFLIELITLLDQSETENDDIKKLKPYLIRTVLENLGFKSYDCHFAYQLYEKGFISLKDITDSINKIINDFLEIHKHRIYNIYTWFFPELTETNFLSIDEIFNNLDELHKKFINLYYPSKIEKFKEMRKSGQPDDELSKSIMNDDIDKLQAILSDKSFGIRIPFNIYDSFTGEGDNSLINYCAHHGSKKCFEYLLSKNESIDSITEMHAIENENNDIYEIIKAKIKQKNVIDAIIINHKNNLIKNIYRNIYQSNDRDFKFLIYAIFRNGNIHSFVKFIEAGLDLYSLPISQIEKMFSFATLNGFYTLTNLLFDLFFKNQNNSKSKAFASNPLEIIYIGNPISIGNLSFLKLYEPYITERVNFGYHLEVAMKNRNYDIIKYSLESPFRQKIYISSDAALNIIKESFNDSDLHMFFYLKKKLINEEKLILDFPDPYDESILTSACSSGNIRIAIIIFESIYQKAPKIDCSLSFFIAASKGYDNICSFLIKRNANIPFNYFIGINEYISTLNIQTISLVCDLAIKEIKEKYIMNFLDKFIQNKNYDVVEFLLEKNAPHDDELFTAVKKSDYKMVSLILKYDSSLLFINRISEDGTVLNIAVKSNQYDIAKHLLSLKGIDPALPIVSTTILSFQFFNCIRI